MSDNNINTYCSICGRGYHVCNSCADQKKIKPWKVVTDSIEHYKIYLILHEYTLSGNKNLAKQELQKCDISDLESFNSNVKSVIKEILAEPQKSKTVLRKNKNERNIELEENSSNE